MVQAKRLSTFHFKGPSIRSVSCYALLREFLLPWPSSDCLNVWTPFYRSKRLVIYLSIMLGAFQSTVSAYQKRSTRDANQMSCPFTNDSSVPSKFVIRSRTNVPASSKHCFRWHDLIHLRYPRRNFERNQLLDGSISLSPLFPNSMNELHVSITKFLRQNFFGLQNFQE